MKISPIQFKKISEHSKKLRNCFASRCYKTSFFLPNTNKNISMKVDFDSPFSVNGYSNHLLFKVDEIQCVLMLERWPLASDIEAYIPEGNLKSLPDDLILATVLTVLDPLIRSIENRIGSKLSSIKYVNTSTSKVNTQNKACIPFTFRTGDESYETAMLLIGERQIENFLSVINRVLPAKNDGLQMLKFPVYIEQGHSNLPASSIKSVEVGDTLIVETPKPMDLINIIMRLPNGQKFIATETANKYKYSLTKEITMEKGDLQQSIDLKELPITITFDAGKTMMTLEELEKVGVGYTLRLESSLNKLVTLRIENQAFAHGEIVEIGDHVGVRVTELSDVKRVKADV